MGKQIIRIAGIMLLCIGFSTTARADFSGDWEYSASGGLATIIEYHGSDATVEIPETLDGNTVTVIGEYAFQYCYSMTSITIPTSITSIGQGAFRKCSNLANITIPDSVTEIGDTAFAYCSSMTSITIPVNVASIGTGVFRSCSNLAEIVVDASNIAYSSLNGVLFNKAVTELIAYPAGKPGTYSVPSSVTSIEDYAFFACTSLTSVTIPDSVTEIGEYVFAYCTNMISITIPANVTSIGTGAFNVCSALTAIVVDAGNTVYSSSNGVLFNKSVTELIAYPAGKPDNTYSIPAGVTSIKDSAFFYCKSLVSIDIPNSVTVIEDSAFKECTLLENITIPDTVTAIGESTFYNCRSLNSITIPNSITVIEDYTFDGCIRLTSITIPNTVTTIGECAFYNCTSLTSITIPASVTTIGNGAFEWCSGLTSVTIPDSVTKIGNGAFMNCTDLISVTIPNSVTQIGNWTFMHCTHLTSIDIPNSVTVIGERAFAGCFGLTSITIPNSVTTIGNNAFVGCSSLISVTIPDSVTAIGNGAFAGCSGLTGIAIPDSVTEIEDDTFRDCISLTSVTIPASVTRLGDRVFYNCINLRVAMFLGHGPITPWTAVFSGCAADFKIIYQRGKTGFTSSICNTYDCQEIYSSLQMNVSPDGTGTTSPSVTETTYAYSSSPISVALQATPEEGYGFLNWSVTGKGAVIDDNSASSTDLALNVTAEYYHTLVTANFSPLVTLTMATAPITGGTVTPATGKVTSGRPVTINAVPLPSYAFAGWDCTDGAIIADVNSPDTTVTLTSDSTVTASFRLARTVMFQTDGTTGATLNGDINQKIADGNNTTPVQAVAPAGYHLTHWSASNGATYSDNPLVVNNVISNLILTANFVKTSAYYTVTFQTDGTVGATLEGNTSQQIAHGSNTTSVKAIAPKGYHLRGWRTTNGMTYRDNPLIINNVTSNLTLTADFTRDASPITFLWLILSGE